MSFDKYSSPTRHTADGDFLRGFSLTQKKCKVVAKPPLHISSLVIVVSDYDFVDL